MKGQVIFLNRWLDCPREILIYHNTLQNEIKLMFAEFLNEIKNLPLEEIKFRKTLLHQRVRSHFYLIKSE